MLIIEEIRQVFNVDLHIGIYIEMQNKYIPCLRYVFLALQKRCPTLKELESQVL